MKIQSHKPQGRDGGFSLVEVTIAMAIAAIALVTLLGLIPQGMQTMQEAGDLAIEARIHQQVLNELQLTPFDGANGGVSPLDRFHLMEIYYDAQGEELSDSEAQGTVAEDRKRGGFAHIYTARISVPAIGGADAPASVGGNGFSGYTFERQGASAPNANIRPVIIEIAAVGGRGDDFRWDDPKNRNLISTYQTVVVKMGRDYVGN